MSDFRLTWGTYNADLSFEDNDLVSDDGLETAVLLSLFTDRRADEADVLPAGVTDRGGWLGDELTDIAGDKTGSRLWLLDREKRSQRVPDRAVEYAREALKWMLDDKVTDKIDVSAVFLGTNGWALIVAIHRPKVDPATFRYNFNWAAQEARVV